MMAEEDELRESIAAFYRFGKMPMPTMKMSDEVAAIFFDMLRDASSCSVAFGYIPHPPGGRATIKWAFDQLKNGLVRHAEKKLSFVCVRFVIANYRAKFY